MQVARVVAGWLCGIAAAIAIGPAHAQTAQPAAPANAVYLIAGLAGFQTGVFDLGEKLRKRGIPATVASHLNSDSVAESIIQRYKAGMRAPIVLLGYSLGADAIGSMAQKLHAHRVPVALLIAFSPARDHAIPPNVARAVNYYQSTSAWRGKLYAAPGFRGSLTNVNLDHETSIHHFNIISTERFQREAIAKISATVSRRPSPSRPVGEAAAVQEKLSSDATAATAD